MATSTGYLAFYGFRTRFGAPLGTALLVIDVFTLLASVANTVETLMLDDHQLTSGKIDIAADVAQIVFYVSRMALLRNSPNIALIRMLMVLKLAQDVMMGLEQLNGFGPPNKGGEFTDGAALLAAAVATLKSVGPAERWSGPAADGYSAQNVDQENVAENIADADREIADIVNRQAGEVEQGREVFASIRLGLYSAMPFAMGCGICTGVFSSNPARLFTDSSAAVRDPAGVDIQLEKYVYTVVGAAGLAALANIGVLVARGISNADDMQSAINIYRDVANGTAVSSGISATAGVLGNGTSGSSGTFARVVEQEGKRAPAIGVGGAEERLRRAGPGEPPVPRQPASNTAAARELDLLSGQSAQRPQRVSQRTGPVSWAVEQARQLAAESRQDPGETAAGDEVMLADPGSVPVPTEVADVTAERVRQAT